MALDLFILLFFTVIPPILTAPREYFLIQQGKTWSQAQAYCQAKYTDLAIIKSNDDMIQLYNESQRQQFSSNAWIGLYNDINSWHWSLGNEPLVGMTVWGFGEPDNKNGNEECGGVGLVGWMDQPCTEMYNFVCFDASKIGSDRYIHISDSVTWYDAQNYCRKYYTDLASVRDGTEYLAVKSLAFSWIGLFRDSWKWIDNTYASNISWLSQQPDNKYGQEDCGYINNRQAGDAKCSNMMPFFCYSVPKRKQHIIRLKIQSSQDVNDSSVKVAILEKIKDELELDDDDEMSEDIMIKWREQPDGMVFHKIKNSTLQQKDDL